MNLLTTIEEVPAHDVPALYFNEPRYIWAIPGSTTSLETVPPPYTDPGWWPTPEGAYQDLQAWLMARPRSAVLPSLVQILIGEAYVTHLVRVG